MEELFNKLKQSFGYLFGKEELAELKMNGSKTQSKSNARDIELEDRLLSKMTDEEKDNVITSKAESLLEKIDKVSANLSYEIKHLTQQDNATWTGFIKSKFGFQSAEVQKLQQHSGAINKFTEGNKAENMANMKELLEISSAAKFIVNTLLDKANKDLRAFQTQQNNKFTEQHAAAGPEQNHAAAELAKQMKSNLPDKGGRG